MEEYHQITLNEWVEMKAQLRRELNNVRTGFVRVGYVLRKMEETEAYKAEGYKSVAEFAEREHGLKPSTTSRWMSINREYSLDGYSMQLDPKWIDMNASQLTEMLALPAEDRELISPGTPREDIRELKRLEKMQEDRSDFEKIVRSFFESNPDDLEELRKMQSEPERYGETAWIGLLVPSGNRAYRKNGAMIFLYEDEIKFKRSGHSPEIVQWSEFWKTVEGIELPDEEDTEGADEPAAVEDREEAPGEADESHGRPEGPAGEGMDDSGRDEGGREEEGSGEEGLPEDDKAEVPEAEDSEETADEEAAVPVSDDLTEEEDAEPADIDIPEEEDVGSEESAGIAPAQKTDKHAETLDVEGDMNKPEIIVDESGNPSPEELPPEEKSTQDERIEAARDNVSLRYAELGNMIREQRWFKARELAAELHEELEFLAGADNEPFRRRMEKR